MLCLARCVTTSALFFSGVRALTLKRELQGDKNTSAQDLVYLYAGDFEGGTYRITKPGKYTLYQDVVFEPRGSDVTDTLFPKADSTKYPQYGGYFLGFFAAITVEANDVEIDCRGHEIKMSERFHKHQRFFSVIELASKPFISGQGPPQFSSHITTKGAVKSARKVLIENCKFGLSSHHGIHGNENYDVTLRNIKIYDFEVGGVALNGASKVHIDGADIGPSLANTFRNPLSQAIFVDHLANTLLPNHKHLKSYVEETDVTLRGKTRKISEVFAHLREELRDFLKGKNEVFGAGDNLPDGSAIYGVLLHRRGVAIGEFGSGCALDPIDHMVGSPVTLSNIQIHDLKLAADQVTRTVIGKGPQLMGPAGDVFQVTELWNKNSNFSYQGNSLSDAQLALAKLKDEVSKLWALHPITYEDAKYYFGAINLPPQVREWAAGELGGLDFKASLMAENAFTCNGDSMSHVNKGVVGMRLEFQKDVEINNITIKSLMNVGKEDAEYCTAPKYQGGDVRAAAFFNCEDVRGVVDTEVGTLIAHDGNAIPQEIKSKNSQLRLASHSVQAAQLATDAPSEVEAMLADDYAPSA
mmetsp:Transcript_97136/g.178041  ORF Transcript_97136/g.178041 Transcript_97136/m.178041 type:complete len:583 (+) Transcript_97136:88-1836(+)